MKWIMDQFKEKDAWREWAKDHVVALPLDEHPHEASFEFIDELLQAKRIVLLGENGHGIAEHNEIRARLIPYLHKKLGFRVLAFECGLTDCGFAELAPADTAEAQMDQSIFRVWRSREVLQVFEYMRHSADHVPLHLAGFDPQYSSTTDLASSWMKRMLGPIHAELTEALIETEAQLKESFVQLQLQRQKHSADLKSLNRQVKSNQRQWTKRYQLAIQLLDQNHIALEQNYGRVAYLLLQRTLHNRQHLIKMLTSSFRNYIRLRDRMMADNLTWLAEVLYPGEKIIVWAHNGHIAKNIRSWFGFVSMGSLLPDRIKRQTYTIGMYMNGGQAATNNRDIYPIAEAPKGSVESILGGLGHRCCYLDLSRQIKKTAGNEWIFSPIVFLDWGQHPNVVSLRKQYDAVMMVNDVRPPDYL